MRSRLVRYGVRFAALGYLGALLIAPLVLIFKDTFAHGLTPVWNALTTVDAVHAAKLSLYAMLIWRSLRILTIAKNLYGALLAAGLGAMLMTQVFVNVGGNVGIMPITGIPLPLMSYGGSSVIVTLIALGILQSVYVQAREAAAGKAETI